MTGGDAAMHLRQGEATVGPNGRYLAGQLELLICKPPLISLRVGCPGRSIQGTLQQLEVSLGSAIQHLDGNGHNVGHAPCGRDPYLAVTPMDALRENVADDRRDPAVAINHGCSRSAVVDDEPILAFIHFQERHAGELPVVSESNEPPFHGMRSAGRKGEGRDPFFRHEWLPAERNTLRLHGGMLEFDDSKLFCLVPRHALNACSDELAAISIRDLKRLPIFGGE